MKILTSAARITAAIFIVVSIVSYRYFSDASIDTSDYLFAVVLLLGILCIRGRA